MTARDTYNSSVASNHNNAEHAGVSSLPGVSAPGNATTWSCDVARAALASGAITQSQFIAAMAALAGWEESQNSLAKSTLRATGDVNPI